MSIWEGFYEGTTGFHHVEVSVDAPEDPYPSFVSVEWESGSMLPDEARAYALLLLAAAEVADQATDAMVLAAHSPPPWVRSNRGEI